MFIRELIAAHAREKINIHTHTCIHTCIKMKPNIKTVVNKDKPTSKICQLDKNKKKKLKTPKKLQQLFLPLKNISNFSPSGDLDNKHSGLDNYLYNENS